jgi:hypothetical protein
VAGYTTWDLGGCGCVSCSPCPLPKADLVATWHNTVTGLTTSFALTYTAGSPFDHWTSAPCVTIPTSSTGGVASGAGSLDILCRNDGIACTAYHVQQWSGAGCTGSVSDSAYQDPALCASGAWTTTWTLLSFSCSPLQIVLARGTGNANTITITP